MNIQGDVVGIVDGTGNIVSTYTYDAWGNITSSTGDLAEINPIRYREYYYDDEIQMYYLQSRYYNQQVGRFINADDTEYIGNEDKILSFNIYTYCMNSPILKSDPTGYWNLSGDDSHAGLIKNSKRYYYNDVLSKNGSKSYVFGKLIKDDKNYYKNAKSLWNKVIDWDNNADNLFSSNDHITAPYHNKSTALEIMDYLLNCSIWFKQKAEKNQKNYDVSFSKLNSKTVKLDGIIMTKWKSKYAKDSIQRKLYLLWGDAPEAYNNKIMSEMNKLSNKNKSVAFLGLALHTLQDYFAHRVLVKVEKKENKKWVEKKNKNKSFTSIQAFGEIGYQKGEDLAQCLKYRYEDAKLHTQWFLTDYKNKLYHKNKKTYDSIKQSKYNEENKCTYYRSYWTMGLTTNALGDTVNGLVYKEWRLTYYRRELLWEYEKNFDFTIK